MWCFFVFFLSKIYGFYIQRDFLITRFSRCMLYRHKAAIGTYLNLAFWDNSLYVSFAVVQIYYVISQMSIGRALFK